jgi:hypothetical protein
VLELLTYDPQDGTFFWKDGCRAGKLAGCLNGQGYRYIGIRGKLYLAHRLAWLMMVGIWPAHQIDHIDRNPLNNRWSNLRSATQAQNQVNARLRRDNTSGFKGVTFYRKDKKRPWYARYGQDKLIGRFATAEEANAARVGFMVEKFGEFV